MGWIQWVFSHSVVWNYPIPSPSLWRVQTTPAYSQAACLVSIPALPRQCRSPLLQNTSSAVIKTIVGSRLWKDSSPFPSMPIHSQPGSDTAWQDCGTVHHQAVLSNQLPRYPLSVCPLFSQAWHAQKGERSGGSTSRARQYPCPFA